MTRFLPLLLLPLAGCFPSGDFSEREMDMLAAMQLTAPPTRHAGDAALGQRMYSDPRFSTELQVASPLGNVGDRDRVSCNVCHDVRAGGADPRGDALSAGVERTSRNTPTVFNVGHKERWGWKGEHATLVDQIMVPLNGGPHRLSVPRAAEVLREHYADDWPGTIPSPEQAEEAQKDGDLSLLEAMAKHLAAYVSQLESANSDLDRYLAYEGELRPDEMAGAKLFVGKAMCTECHRGPLLTDDELHVLGVSYRGVPYAELDEGAAEKRGAFVTASLRNLSQTGPYMHNGALGDLWDVVDFYDVGGDDVGFVGTKDRRMQPLGLTEREKDQLVAFLMTLDGEPIDDRLLPPIYDEDED